VVVAAWQWLAIALLGLTKLQFLPCINLQFYEGWLLLLLLLR
jgi:hypothetical protein